MLFFTQNICIYLYKENPQNLKKKTKKIKCLQCLSFAFCSESGNSKSKNNNNNILKVKRK